MKNMIETPASLVAWHDSHVSYAERCRLLNQQAMTIWLTGLSGAGKSTLAFSLERSLIDLGHACYVLDGDNIRHGLSSNLGFSNQDRSENIRRISEVAKLMNDAGLIVIAAFISPYRTDRALAKSIVGADFFREVYVSTALSVCESRDPKGLYAKARRGEVVGFTGVSSPYEIPESPDMLVDTDVLSTDEAVSKLISLALPRLDKFELNGCSKTHE